MKITAADYHTKAFLEGFHGDFKENPHLLSSNNSDAFELGQWAARMSLPESTPIHKSRGNFWLVGGVKHRVEGRRITAA